MSAPTRASTLFDEHGAPVAPSRLGKDGRLRLLTGLRPTGRLHLGNYVGTLEKDVQLQDDPRYECFFLVADFHALTTGFERSREVESNIRETLLDFLAVGIDPERSTIYLQSLVPEVAELFLLFSMLVSVSRAQRIPTLKEQVRDLRLESASLGLLNYPVLQAADILMVRGEVVPVGEDQLSHIELTREIARRFNGLYGAVFPESQGHVGRVATLPGLDGKPKMSKSIGNTVELADDAETVQKKIKRMFVGEAYARQSPTKQGILEGNPLFIYHELFNDDAAQVDDLKARYTAGQVGDGEIKSALAAALNRFLDPIRQRRAHFASRPGYLDEVVAEGTSRARREARDTLEMARDAMGMGYFGDARRRVELAVQGGRA
ncbi:MAG: tryptophan--tRNA ligase [Chloroflexi bacterium]|nr:tryptophan--tRNA ligase [Chloroflexota bacterium]